MMKDLELTLITLTNCSLFARSQDRDKAQGDFIGLVCILHSFFIMNNNNKI